MGSFEGFGSENKSLGQGLERVGHIEGLTDKRTIHIRSEMSVIVGLLEVVDKLKNKQSSLEDEVYTLKATYVNVEAQMNHLENKKNQEEEGKN